MDKEEQYNKYLHIKEDKKKNIHKGKLKIFFGFAAGVGKTYAMLEAAHQAQKKGIDVVVGYVERHAREDTLALLDGLEIIPTKKIPYKNVMLEEFDIDAALERKPSLILIDELAHTNAIGSRHKKRYQDIEEILQAGIDVYTTVNVQHLESLNDVVTSITNIVVHERVPDKIFDQADEVEVIDIEENDLISRLEAGKIYRKIQAQRALKNFFTVDNLGALREIALRRTAERLSHKAQTNVSKPGIKASEHILVCISASPSNPKVIRTAARMAKAFHSGFTALVVENADIKNASEENRKRLEDNIKLAEQLGAQISTVFGDDLPKIISEYAKVSGITKIVMGRTNHKSSFWSGKSLVDILAPLVGDIDIYIIPDNQPLYVKRIKWKNWFDATWDLNAIIKTILIIIISTILGFASDNWGLREANIITIYIVGVLFVALWTSGYIYGVVSAFIGVLLFNYFFTEPRYSLHVYDPSYILTFMVMIVASILVSALTLRTKKQEQASAQKAYYMELLLESNNKLQSGKDDFEILKLASEYLGLVLQRPVYYAKKRDDNQLNFYSYQDETEKIEKNMLSTEEKAVAEWVLKNNSYAGATTNTFSHIPLLFYAVRGIQDVMGVIAIPMMGYPDISVSERNLMVAIINECGIIMERQSLRINAEKIKLEKEQEHLRGNLLRSISHDLRTPLTSISGYAHMLIQENKSLTEEEKNKIYNDIYDDSMWLIHLTENLLSITKIEGGKLQIAIEPELVSDVIEEAIQHVDRNIVKHHLEIDIQDNLLMAKMDGTLIRQVLINIINNAIKYTPEGSNIVVRAVSTRDDVTISVEDNGKGIPKEDREHLFDMFYKSRTLGVSADSRRGMRLGLHLCQSIIRAHDSEIYVRDNYPQGTIFSFTLKREMVKFNV